MISETEGVNTSFRAHRLGLEFSAGDQSWIFMHAARVAGEHMDWHSKDLKGSWLFALNDWLLGLGWEIVEPWKWTHAFFGELNAVDLSPENLNLQRHLLRESWSLFLKFAIGVKAK